MRYIFMTVLGTALLAGAARATTVPFTESFASGASSWRDTTGAADASWISVGGADGGGYITQALNFAAQTTGATPLLVRSDSAFGSSGGALYGDWLGDGVSEFSFFVRHDAPTPISVFARFATPIGGQGAIALAFAPVLPNVWTPIAIAIDPLNPQFISFEAADFGTVFSNVQRVQLGLSVPAALAGANVTYNFGFDEVGIVPEPASAALLALTALGLLRRRACRL